MTTWLSWLLGNANRPGDTFTSLPTSARETGDIRDPQAIITNISYLLGRHSYPGTLKYIRKENSPNCPLTGAVKI